MKHLIKKYSLSRSNVIGHVRVNDSGICIIAKDNVIRTIVNGCDIFNIPMDKNAIDVVAHVLANIVFLLNKAEDKPKIVIITDDWNTDGEYPSTELLDKTIKYVKPQVQENNLVIKKKEQGERNISQFLSPNFSSGTPISTDILKRNLEVLSGKLRGVTAVLQEGTDYGMMLTRRKLINSMWGAKPTQLFLESARLKLSENSESTVKLDFFCDLIDKGLNQLVSKTRELSNGENIKYICNILIPDIISNYEAIKNIIIKGVIALTPLIYLDEIFQKNTSFPSSWFVSDELMGDIVNSYDNLIAFLATIPKIESRVIFPLDFYKHQISQ